MAWRGEHPGAYGSRGGNQAAGYYAGYGPTAGGSGSGGGQAMAGRGQLAAGQGVSIAGNDWHPTILYLFALVIGELFVFGLLARFLR